MSAIFQSVSSTTPTESNSVVISKPTGLEIGNLMIAHLCKVASGVNTIDLSGWTSVLDVTNTTVHERVMYKIADSGDVSASDFTFTGSGTDAFTGGAIYRISGHDPVTPVDVSNSGTWSGSSANVAAGVTPNFANELFLFLIVGGSGNTNVGTVNSQAIATDNPSWTEDYDTRFSSSSICLISGAHATRPQVTATGNLSFLTDGTNMNGGIVAIVAIKTAVINSNFLMFM